MASRVRLMVAWSDTIMKEWIHFIARYRLEKGDKHSYLAVNGLLSDAPWCWAAQCCLKQSGPQNVIVDIASLFPFHRWRHRRQCNAPDFLHTVHPQATLCMFASNGVHRFGGAGCKEFFMWEWKLCLSQHEPPLTLSAKVSALDKYSLWTSTFQALQTRKAHIAERVRYISDCMESFNQSSEELLSLRPCRRNVHYWAMSQQRWLVPTCFGKHYKLEFTKSSSPLHGK